MPSVTRYVEVWNCVQCGRENEEQAQCLDCMAYRPRDGDGVRWEHRPGPFPNTSSEAEQTQDTSQVTFVHQKVHEYLATLDHNEDIELQIPASVEAANSVLVDSQKQQKIPEDPDDGASTISTISDSEDSVFSIESSDTLATEFTRESGFSFEQIQMATRILVLTLQNDELLAPLYESARNNIRIGPKRLRKHIREDIETFAEQLKEEAHDDLQHAACRLVQAKARYAARSIAGGKDTKDQLPVSGEPRDQTSNDLEDSSEEETADRPVNHTGLEDLEAFRLFLTGSGAYTTLQADLHAFCTRNSKPPPRIPIIDDLQLKSPTAAKKRRESDTTLLRYALSVCGLLIVSTVAIIAILGALIISRSTTATPSNSKKGYSMVRSFNPIRLARAASYVMTDVVFPLTDDLLMALGLLEPPLKVGWTRIRTECVSLLHNCQYTGTRLTMNKGMWRSLL